MSTSEGGEKLKRILRVRTGSTVRTVESTGPGSQPAESTTRGFPELRSSCRRSRSEARQFRRYCRRARAIAKADPSGWTKAGKVAVWMIPLSIALWFLISFLDSGIGTVFMMPADNESLGEYLWKLVYGNVEAMVHFHPEALALVAMFLAGAVVAVAGRVMGCLRNRRVARRLVVRAYSEGVSEHDMVAVRMMFTNSMKNRIMWRSSHFRVSDLEDMDRITDILGGSR